MTLRGKSSSTPMATCPRDGEPLIATLAFRKAEFYCLDCGRRYGFFDPTPREATPELNARLEALQREWDENAGRKLITAGGWNGDCEKCAPRGETHEVHATAEEVDAHEAAIAWLRERAARGAPG